MSSEKPEKPGETEPDDKPDVVFYEGSPRVRGELGLIAIAFVAAVIFAAIPFLIAKVFGGAAWWVYAGGFLLAIGCVFVPPIWVKRHWYRVTDSRIDTREGLLSVRDGTLWLWKVDDVQLNRSILDRMLGVGTITVYSSDATHPRMQLRSLPEPQKVFSELKTRVDKAKRQRGVLRVDADVLHTDSGA